MFQENTEHRSEQNFITLRKLVKVGGRNEPEIAFLILCYRLNCQAFIHLYLIKIKQFLTNTRYRFHNFFDLQSSLYLLTKVPSYILSRFFLSFFSQIIARWKVFCRKIFTFKIVDALDRILKVTG